MSQRILIDPVTRIEGHAKISIYLDDAGEVTDARFHVTEFRGFERFCEGRPFCEMAGLTARICGICPVSHLMASAKAGDQIMAVDIPPAAEKLRRLMNLGQIVQSHALSFFHLSAPDLLLGWDSDPATRNVFGLIKADPELARARHPPATIRPGNHRVPRRQEDPSRLVRARRRARRADRGAPRPSARLAAGGAGDGPGGPGAVQEHARRLPGGGARPSATFRRCSWGWSARTAAGNTTAAASASRTATARSSPTGSRPRATPSSSARPSSRIRT